MCCTPVFYVVCVMKLAACTGDAAQSLLYSHGLGEGIRRERICIKPLPSLCAYIRRAPLVHSLLTIGLYMVRLYM